MYDFCKKKEALFQRNLVINFFFSPLSSFLAERNMEKKIIVTNSTN